MLQVTGIARPGLFGPITFTVSPADRLVISGPSGSGKTLLLRALAELDPHEGTMLLDARPSRTFSTPVWRSLVMYVPQRPAFPAETVRHVLHQSCLLRTHRNRTFSEQHAIGLLETLGRSAELLDRSTLHLSGGEAQTVALVRALILKPRILLADEITAALDTALARRVEEHLIEWSRQPGRALIWVGHNTAENNRIATTSITLKKP